MRFDRVVDSWDTWLRTLPDDRARQATELRQRLADAGCPDPEDWATSEIDEDIAQAARYRFLRDLWPRMIDSWRDGIDTLPAGQHLLRTGADRDDVVRLARAVAFDTVFAMLYHLADDNPAPAVARLPGWALMEVDDDEELTGRLVDSLHEDLLSMDPSGTEAADLR